MPASRERLGQPHHRRGNGPPTHATDDEKKLVISEFIRDEHGIEVVDAVRELLKIQLIEAIDEDYILELKQGIQE